MSSDRFQLIPTLPQHVKYAAKTPVHASFSRDNDALAVLWQTGYLEVWEMHTRLGPGRGKVFEQIKAWSGFMIEEDTVAQWRQVALKSLSTMWIVTVLGSRSQQDIIGTIRLERGAALKQTLELEKRNLKILDDGGEYIQEPEGGIYQCGYRSYSSQPSLI